MTIEIKDNIDDLTAINLVKQVIEQGKICPCAALFGLYR